MQSIISDRTGVIHLTDSDDMPNGQINGSDFLLVEVEDPILDTWEPFYAGWDATGFNGNGGVGIHHPSGDRKKISTYTNSLINSNAYAIGAHWRVQWAATQTNHGVTEGGRQVLPIFEENHRILGTLSGGLRFAMPLFARLLRKDELPLGWSQPHSNFHAFEGLSHPAGTGEELMDGSYVQEDGNGNGHDMYTSCDVSKVEDRFLSGLTVVPNPSRDMVTITLPAGFELSRAVVRRGDVNSVRNSVRG